LKGEKRIARLACRGDQPLVAVNRLVKHQREQAVGHGHVNALPFTSPLAVQQRRDHPARGHGAGDGV